MAENKVHAAQSIIDYLRSESLTEYRARVLVETAARHQLQGRSMLRYARQPTCNYCNAPGFSRFLAYAQVNSG